MESKEYQCYDSFLNKTVFIVSEILKDSETYRNTYDTLYNFMKQGFELEEVRKHPLKFKFHNTEKKIHTLEIRHFIINLIMWYPMMKLEAANDIDDSFILDCYNLSSDSIIDAINRVIVKYRMRVTNRKMNRIHEKLIHMLSGISKDFNVIMGMGISTETFISLAKRNAEFNQLIRTKPEPGMQPKDIEIMIHEKTERLVEILRHEDNDLQPMLLSGTGIKTKQLGEMAVMGGHKPNDDGFTIPVPIDSNNLVGGMNSVSNIYLDSSGARKSAVMNKTQMGRSGYLSSKIMMLTSNTRISTTVDDCGTKVLIPYEVKTKKHLKKMHGRVYKINNWDNEKIIDSSKDKHLIGQTILMRSPMTCTAGPDEVCPRCYGPELAYINKDRGFNPGGLAAVEVSNKMLQDILSAKHLLTTNSAEIQFCEEFNKFFVLVGNKIRVHPELDNPENYFISVENDDMFEIVSFDEGDFNEFASCMYVRDKKKGTKYKIFELTEKDMYFYNDVMGLASRDDEKIEINLGKLEDEADIALIIVENNELTKPLKEMVKLLNRKDHSGCETIEQLLNKMADLIIEANMRASMVHPEMIMRNIIRDSENILERPRFNTYGRENKYSILRIDEALLNNPSVTVGLSFQDLKKQFTNPLTYKKKGSSTLDSFFRMNFDD